MSIVKTYNQEGIETGIIELPPQIFDIKPKVSILEEVVRAMRANVRRPIAHTKTRGEVRGGGKKPWRQKGTGRARHGSIRSPIWVGGGITFGPRSNRNFSLKVNKKVRKQALRMSLSAKVHEGNLMVLDGLIASSYQTKPMVALLEKLNVEGSALVILGTPNRMITNSFRNIPKVEAIPAGSLNLLKILGHRKLIVTKEAVEKIVRLLGNL